MKLLSVALLLAAVVNLISGRPEIKSADPSQRFQTPAFLTEQERRYTEAIKGLHHYRPLPTQVIPQKTDRHERRGR
uniref:Uncharacterized protein n=1 Tax=Pristhesancus plagipennis TaxID=1955184 RepID=A0A2K8JMA0_PRIPG|nr:secreted hypothetical protein [Pristhesancus plagipennis]